MPQTDPNWISAKPLRINTNGEAYDLCFLVQRPDDVLLPPLICLEARAVMVYLTFATWIMVVEGLFDDGCYMDNCGNA